MDFQPDEEIAFKRNPEVVLLDEDEEASKATVKIPADEVHSLPAAQKKMPSAEPTPRRNSVPSPVVTSDCSFSAWTNGPMGTLPLREIY